MEGQKKISRSSVLLVGAGGLASPAALYLAGAGVGRIGIIDYDCVETSNLQRQIIHDESSVGMSKVMSACKTITRFNSSIECVPYNELFTSSNALDIVRPYDLVLDCTDNVVTRYLLNDVCVISGKVLISGSALRMEGQVAIYNDKLGGPCYRCLFKDPPPREAQGSCNTDGVLGVVPGIIGCIQALEAIKVLSGGGTPLYGKMLLFDALSCTFRSFKIRSRNPNCDVCGESPTITKPIDYEQFCNAKADDKALMIDVIDSHEHISVKDYARVRESTPHLLLDVREKTQYEICSLEGSFNIPLEDLKSSIDSISEKYNPSRPIYTICRYGNDSQLALKFLKNLGYKEVWNIKGGLSKWTEDVDHSFPSY